MKYWIRQTVLALGWLLLIACVYLRIYPVTYSYEYDELFTAITADPSVPLSYIWNTYLMPDVHPPLHNLLLYVWNHFVPFGPEIWLRMPSQVFGVMALVFAWFMFPKRWGRTARWMFMLMLASHPFGIFYTQHARAYALMLCLSVPLTFLFLEISRCLAKGWSIRVSRWIGWAVTGLLLCWSHYFGALLFGVFSILLFVQSLYYKRRIWPIVGVTACVFALFLPWLLPNLYQNITLERFDGAWWANATPSRYIMPGLVDFFFSSLFGYWILCVGLCGAIWKLYRTYKAKKPIAYIREIILLTAAIGMVMGAALVLLLKLYLFFGRYFMELVPAVFLLCTLLLVPLVRRRIWALFSFLVFILLSLYAYAFMYASAEYTLLFSARASAEMYIEKYAGRELFVVAMEAFPDKSMKPMHEFYPNKIFHIPTRVTELYQMDVSAREKLLQEEKNAIIWMPNCNAKKLARLAKEWDRSIGIENRVGTSCFFQLSERGMHGVAPEWKKNYTPQRIRVKV